MPIPHFTRKTGVALLALMKRVTLPELRLL